MKFSFSHILALSPSNKIENTFIKLVSAMIENVHNALDQVFPIIKSPMGNYDFHIQPVLTYACIGLYNAVRSKTGFIGDYRFDYLYDYED